MAIVTIGNEAFGEAARLPGCSNTGMQVYIYIVYVYVARSVIPRMVYSGRVYLCYEPSCMLDIYCN